MRGRQFLSSDHIVEMIPPIWTLGKEFLASTTFERKGDIFRIVGEYNHSYIPWTTNCHQQGLGL